VNSASKNEEMSIMGHHHRAGISLGLVVVALGGGIFGYFVGHVAPSIVFNLGNPGAEVVGAFVMAAIAGAIWAIGEAIVGLTGAIGRDAVFVRLWISLIGSFVSVVTTGLTLLGVTTGQPDPHSIFAYGPIASGLGSIALGVHALLHQLHLNRESRGA
jgi:hypothetical protein